MDDLWFYDLNAHAWKCLYPGTDTKAFTRRVKDKELVIDGDGQLIDKARAALRCVRDKDSPGRGDGPEGDRPGRDDVGGRAGVAIAFEGRIPSNAMS